MHTFGGLDDRQSTRETPTKQWNEATSEITSTDADNATTLTKTQPPKTEGIDAELRAMVVDLRAIVADLRAENARLRAELGQRSAPVVELAERRQR